MAELPAYGYRETGFEAKAGDREACGGSVLKSLLA